MGDSRLEVIDQLRESLPRTIRGDPVLCKDSIRPRGAPVAICVIGMPSPALNFGRRGLRSEGLCGSSADPIDVFYQHDFIALLAVEKLVDAIFDQQQAEAAGP
jgi:hypothetical protein